MNKNLTPIKFEELEDRFELAEAANVSVQVETVAKAVMVVAMVVMVPLWSR